LIFISRNSRYEKTNTIFSFIRKIAVDNKEKCKTLLDEDDSSLDENYEARTVSKNLQRLDLETMRMKRWMPTEDIPGDRFLGRCGAVASKYTFCGHSAQLCHCVTV
jgi:hypothetical protein